jgi:hypothetical protein
LFLSGELLVGMALRYYCTERWWFWTSGLSRSEVRVKKKSSPGTSINVLYVAGVDYCRGEKVG